MNIRRVSIAVSRITLQPSRYKPVSMDPVEMEALRLKRALVSITVIDDSKKSQISAVVEFRGRALTLSRVKGDCNLEELVRLLARYYNLRYDKHAFVGAVSISDGGKIGDCTILNPDQFLDFLHLIKNHGGLFAHTPTEWSVLHERPKETYALSSEPTDVHGDVIINPGAKPLSVEKKEPESTKPKTTQPGTTVLVDKAVVIQPRDVKEYKIVLKKGQVATIEAGADYPITVELISQTEILKTDKRHLKTIEVERSKTVKNANIEYEAKRNGTWFVHIHNDQRKLPLEVGVIISVE